MIGYMSKPSVSVVIPICDRREQLAQALASVLQQTRPVDEIVVVDDGSTDDTREMLVDLVGTCSKMPSTMKDVGVFLP
ncbi:glycosyltransferase [Betaproteobacteria bacterium SCN2]|jgi:glycosyltransferase involved in cell wall biosynthesis|nr:glycosyltransferase [Betaproteobacteria bacterium SCN2]